MKRNRFIKLYRAWRHELCCICNVLEINTRGVRLYREGDYNLPNSKTYNEVWSTLVRTLEGLKEEV